jgi:hypothetical protein
MKKILISLLFTQISFAQIKYNDCEIRPSLKNRKDFVSEIVKSLATKESLVISFYISREGEFFAILVNDKKDYPELHKILTKLGEWNAGEKGGIKVVTRIEFSIKVLKEDE